MRSVLNRIGPTAVVVGWAVVFVIALIAVGPIVADGFTTLAHPHVA
jgi:hypothetical protein